MAEARHLEDSSMTSGYHAENSKGWSYGSVKSSVS